MERFLVTMDIEKAFDSLNHNFLISALEKYGFGKNFISPVRSSLGCQVLCDINEGTRAKYFSFMGQVTQFQFFLFILALEILFFLVKCLRLKE